MIRIALIAALALTACDMPQQDTKNELLQQDEMHVASRFPTYMPPAPTPVRTPQIIPLYRLKGERALACDNARFLAPLVEPDAHARLGEINFMRIAQDGRCSEIGNSRPLSICEKGDQFISVSQYFGPGAFSRCFAIQTSDLGPQTGETKW